MKFQDKIKDKSLSINDLDDNLLKDINHNVIIKDNFTESMFLVDINDTCEHLPVTNYSTSDVINSSNNNNSSGDTTWPHSPKVINAF